MINTIIFDLGNVLIDWNPAYVYRTIFETEEEVKHFLDTVCSPDWNEAQDGGRSLQEATDILIAEFPEQEANIRAYYGRYEEMLGGPLPGSVEILRGLKESKNYRLLALTNWSAETFPVALRKFDFLGWFDGIVVSGVEKNRKPFPDFYQLLLDRYEVKAEEALFIDDNFRNILAAREMGIESIHFTSPEELDRALKEKEIL